MAAAGRIGGGEARWARAVCRPSQRSSSGLRGWRWATASAGASAGARTEQPARAAAANEARGMEVGARAGAGAGAGAGARTPLARAARAPDWGLQGRRRHSLPLEGFWGATATPAARPDRTQPEHTSPHSLSQQHGGCNDSAVGRCHRRRGVQRGWAGEAREHHRRRAVSSLAGIHRQHNRTGLLTSTHHCRGGDWDGLLEALSDDYSGAINAPPLGDDSGVCPLHEARRAPSFQPSHHPPPSLTVRTVPSPLLSAGSAERTMRVCRGADPP